MVNAPTYDLTDLFSKEHRLPQQTSQAATNSSPHKFWAVSSLVSSIWVDWAEHNTQTTVSTSIMTRCKWCIDIWKRSRGISVNLIFHRRLFNYARTPRVGTPPPRVGFAYVQIIGSFVAACFVSIFGAICNLQGAIYLNLRRPVNLFTGWSAQTLVPRLPTVADRSALFLMT